MQPEQRRALERRYRTAEWRGRSRHAKRAPKSFRVDDWKIPGWLLQRMRRDDLAQPKLIHSVWRNEDRGTKRVVIDGFACPSVEAAHDQLIEALSEIESEFIERQEGKTAVGDVAFAVRGAMVYFARANLLLLIRSAGPESAPVENIAHYLDKSLERVS